MKTKKSILYPFIGLLIASVLLIVSCKRNNLIPSQQLVDILVEIQKADALKDAHSNYVADTVAIYGSILKKYGLTIDDFKNTMNHYYNDPKRMTQLYSAVLIRLNGMKKEYELLAIEERKANNLWKTTDSLSVNSDSIHTKFDFDVPVKGKGTYTITANIHIFADDSTHNPRIKAYFASESKPDTVVAEKKYEINKIDMEQKINLTLYLNDTLMNRLKGRLIDYDSIKTTPAIWRQHISIRDIYVEYVEGDGIDPHVLLKGKDEKPDKNAEKLQLDTRFINSPMSKTTSDPVSKITNPLKRQREWPVPDSIKR